MNNQKALKNSLTIVLIFLVHSIFAQSLKQEKMEQLDFMVGEWVGTTKIYEDGVVVREGSAHENIAYDLDKNILVIELNTEFLQLHTVVLFMVAFVVSRL